MYSPCTQCGGDIHHCLECNLYKCTATNGIYIHGIDEDTTNGGLFAMAFPDVDIDFIKKFILPDNARYEEWWNSPYLKKGDQNEGERS